MRVSLRLLSVVAMGAVITACTGQEAVPTLLPPTAPQVTEVPVTDAPTPTPLSRATLPPTWTPFVAETATPDATPTIDIRETLVNLTPTLEACFSFGEDTERTQMLFTPGDSVSIYWTLLPEAVEYEVRLFDESNNVLAEGITISTEFRFEGTLFEFERSYYWTVRPFDDLGNQLCPVTGGLLLPSI